MLNYWGIFFMGGFVPMVLVLGGYLTYLCEKEFGVSNEVKVNERSEDRRMCLYTKSRL